MTQMTACRGCGEQVAVTAKTCPACGQARPGLNAGEAKTHAVATIAYTSGCLILLTLFVLLALGFIFAVAF